MKRIICYSAEKYCNDGNGSISIRIDTKGKSQQEINEEIKKVKDKFKRANREFRQGNPPNKRKLKANNEVPNSKINELLKVTSKYDLKFDEDTGNTTFIIGSAKRGKSTLLMDIYNKYYNDKNIITTLFSVNSHIKLYKDKSKRLIKCNKFDKPCSDLVRMMKRINFKCKNKYNFTVMFDDIVNIGYNMLVNQLILTFRNSNISSVISLQYPNLLSKASRGSINNLIFFGLNNDESIVVALNSFLKSHFAKLGVIGETEQINFYRELTKDHQFIYLHPETNHMSVHKLKIPRD